MASNGVLDARERSAMLGRLATERFDVLEGTRRPVPHHRHLSARGALKRAPALSPDRLAGAMLYYDAQVDDARHTLTVARTAAAHKAVIATRVSAVEVLRGPDGTRV